MEPTNCLGLERYENELGSVAQDGASVNGMY